MILLDIYHWCLSLFRLLVAKYHIRLLVSVFDVFSNFLPLPDCPSYCTKRLHNVPSLPTHRMRPYVVMNNHVYSEFLMIVYLLVYSFRIWYIEAICDRSLNFWWCWLIESERKPMIMLLIEYLVAYTFTVS